MPRDAPFLELMLLAAAGWSPDRRMTMDQLRGEPDLIHHIRGWPPDGDTGLVADDAHGSPIGAVWLRYFAAEDPGYGFVAADVPELSIASSNGGDDAGSAEPCCARWPNEHGGQEFRC